MTLLSIYEIEKAKNKQTNKQNTTTNDYCREYLKKKLNQPIAISLVHKIKKERKKNKEI